MARAMVATLLVITVLGAGIALAAFPESDVDELKIIVEHKPQACTQKAKAGDSVNVHYTGYLTDGTKFDSSRDRSQPIGFQLGKGQVIAGWDRGLDGACPGEKRLLHIPPHMAYGDRGAGGVIPPKATLIFETEMVSINP